MNTKEKIAVMEGCVAGKPMQARKVGGRNWYDYTAHPNWNWDVFTYRIKPEPREIWINTYQSGSTGIYESEEDAFKAVGRSSQRIKTAKFIEVLED